MTDERASSLRGKCAFILDDEPLLAHEVEDILRELGCEICGPHYSLAEAQAAYTLERERIDFAVLDILIDHEPVWPLAERMDDDGKAFAFLSAFCRGGIPLPGRFEQRPCLVKPLDEARLRASFERIFS